LRKACGFPQVRRQSRSTFESDATLLRQILRRQIFWQIFWLKMALDSNMLANLIP
jgi:hypothetical protein